MNENNTLREKLKDLNEEISHKIELTKNNMQK